MSLARGFKGHAETTSEEIRAELALKNIDRLDPHALLEHLEVPALSLSDLARLALDDPDLQSAVHMLRGPESSSLSAVTVFRGHRRLVIYNDTHQDGRQANGLCHEAAHAILLHTPSPAIDDLGCRLWDQDIEDEADYLGGALLIPGKAARYAAKANWSMDLIAEKFGCSTQMARWRNNASGGQRLRSQATGR